MSFQKCLVGVEIKNQIYIFLLYNNFSKTVAVFLRTQDLSKQFLT